LKNVNDNIDDNNNKNNNSNNTSIKPKTISRGNTFIQQLNKELNDISENSNIEDDNSWGGVLTGSVKSRSLKSSKRSSFINPNVGPIDNDPSSTSPIGILYF